MRAFSEGKFGDDLSVQNLDAMTATTCSSVGTPGLAGIYPCLNVDLKSFMPLSDIGQIQSNDEANDIWGWTDPLTGKEYAIIGRVFGTSFVDISNQAAPVYLGQLSTHGRFGSSWRDIKVYNDHAFIVSEARRHGMQVFDLTLLRSVTAPPVAFSETAHYRGFNTAHNIVINEDSGYAYGVGTDKCNGGLAMVNILDPRNPRNAGCFSADGYTHDAQCVIYSGPDTGPGPDPDIDYTGKEICFASNEDTVTIVDVSNKANPAQISQIAYAGSAYTHQGWLSEDQRYFLMDDELDERRDGHYTRTRIWDVSNLESPVPIAPIDFFDGRTLAIDHNQYVHGDCTFQANYQAGLSINKFDPATPSFTEWGFFDIYPTGNAAEFNAAWSNYPYFDSGVVIISGIEQGLFVVKPTDEVLQECGLNNAAPTAVITSPNDGSIFVTDEKITFTGTASDVEDDDTTLTLAWTSDIDGAIGTSGSFLTSLSDGNHTITASVTDSGGKTGNASISITVAPPLETTEVSVDSITYATEGGRNSDKHLSITVQVDDDPVVGLGNPIAGANVATTLNSTTTDSSWTFTGTTGADGTVTFTLKNVASDCYTADVTDVTADGLTWVGGTPTNEFCNSH